VHDDVHNQLQLKGLTMKKLLWLVVLAACGAGATRIPANLYKPQTRGEWSVKIPDGWKIGWPKPHFVGIDPDGKGAVTIDVTTIKLKDGDVLVDDPAVLDPLVQQNLKIIVTVLRKAKFDEFKTEQIPGGRILCAIGYRDQDNRKIAVCDRIDSDVKAKRYFHEATEVAISANYNASGQHYLAVDIVKDAHLPPPE
jgi:hypothetical protein